MKRTLSSLGAPEDEHPKKKKFGLTYFTILLAMDLTIINMLPPANYVHSVKVHRNCTYYSFYSSSLNWESKGSARAVTATESTS